jgi:hypothetical protein
MRDIETVHVLPPNCDCLIAAAAGQGAQLDRSCPRVRRGKAEPPGRSGVAPSELLFPEERSLSYLNDPERLRVRAKETRAMAERETDVAVKLTMLTIAAEYEQLAQRTEDSRSGMMRKD